MRAIASVIAASILVLGLLAVDTDAGETLFEVAFFVFDPDGNPVSFDVNSFVVVGENASTNIKARFSQGRVASISGGLYRYKLTPAVNRQVRGKLVFEGVVSVGKTSVAVVHNISANVSSVLAKRLVSGRVTGINHGLGKDYWIRFQSILTPLNTTDTVVRSDGEFSFQHAGAGDHNLMLMRGGKAIRSKLVRLDESVPDLQIHMTSSR